jgi:hypothetical protein
MAKNPYPVTRMKLFKALFTHSVGRRPITINCLTWLLNICHEIGKKRTLVTLKHRWFVSLKRFGDSLSSRIYEIG